MEEECEEWRTWEQSIYWTHFQSIHFCQILDSDFRSQLMIPRKFSDYARGKLQDKVTLKGPTGSTTWEVRLTVRGAMLFLRDGWTKFVNAFSLEQNDILIFKYHGNSCFSILIFDTGSLCEKESSYFIKKCGHSRPCKRNQEKRFLKGILEEFPKDYLHEEFQSTPSKKPRKDTDGQNLGSRDHHTASDIPDMSHLKTPYADVDTASDRPRNQQESWTWEPMKLPPSTDYVKEQKPPTKVTYVSQRQPITEEQKGAALRMARKELTADSFLGVMRPSHVYKRFFMIILVAWMNRHLTFKKQLVRLRTIENTWPAKLLCLSDGRAGLSLGWRAFALENCLEESDVCLFELASQKHEPAVLDISIFRVVPDVMKSVWVPQACTKKLPDGQNSISPEQQIASDIPDMSHLETPYVHGSDSERPRNQQESWTLEPMNLPPVIEKQKPSTKATYVFQRRPVTEEEKEAALCMAQKELTADSFLVVMRRSHVYKSFFMNIPVAWMNLHLAFKKQLVHLRMKENTWPTKLICLSKGRAGFGLGWKAFALDNCLEEFDVCVFKLASQKLEPVIIDVNIFRVVPEVV